ncbi:hypothetical protein [Streptomyces sp. CC224B]|uniref:hypothetical protein n=1 Tax=Streptomyces sp. CC224B TaxID=3044571 RepID=UPI0024A89CE7|nr:hypothetical protein [Streptomyces sp. CC224B]
MSNVTSVFVIVGDSGGGSADEVAPKVAGAIADFIPEVSASPPPVISLGRDDWHSLQGGSKGADGAVLWFGWNYGDGHVDELERHLQRLGFENITVWSQGGAAYPPLPPRVTSW